MTTALTQANTNSVDQTSQALATVTNNSSTATNINQAIGNMVGNSVTESTVQELKAILKNVQNNNIIIDGPVVCTKENPFLIDNIQNIVSEQIANFLTSVVTNRTVEDIKSVLSDIDIDNTIKQKAGGLAEVITSLFDGLAKLLSMPFVILGIIIFVLVIMVYVFKGFIFKKKTDTKFGYKRR